jgi:chromosome segregation ATPase
VPGLTDAEDDFTRLERAVHALVDRQRALGLSELSARRDLETSDRRIRVLEEEVRDLNQQRCDVAKRIDDLVAQIERLEADLLARGS